VPGSTGLAGDGCSGDVPLIDSSASWKKQPIARAEYLRLTSVNMFEFMIKRQIKKLNVLRKQ
jgi:hypothetical protein